MMQIFFVNTIVFFAAGSLGLSAFALSPQVKSEQTRKSCETAIADSRGRLEKRRDITVRTSIVDRSELYSNPPSDRPLFVGITVGGDAAAASSVMLSPVLQKAIASDIIKSCDSVGAVWYGKQQTDWYFTFGLMPSGTIERFKCIDAPQVNRISWGQQVCL
jgi:hypothetical protein